MIRFNTFLEIEAHTQFRADNPLTQATYAGIIGWYAFEQGHDIACCVQQPTGYLCRHLHRKGWVVLLTDRSITVIGGDCAREKFGVDSVMGQDLARAESSLDAAQLRARLDVLLARREEQLKALHGCKVALRERDEQMAQLQGSLPSSAWRALSDMARLGNSRIIVIGVTPAKTNSDGDIVRDRVEIQIVAGQLSGIAGASEVRRASARKEVDQLHSDISKFTSTDADSMSRGELKKLTAMLDNVPRAIATLNAYISEVDRFLANDFRALALALPDANDQLHTLTRASGRAGGPLTKTQARELLREMSSELAARHRVTRIIAP